MTTRRIGDYEILELLGEGAMGKVYRARDLNLERDAAIKLLGERTLGDPSFIDRFKREARLAAQLTHPHIAVVYAFGEHEGEAYIAMEFVQGETLEARIAREGQLPVPEVKRLARQAASALAVAHELGIVHRDIKSANLMINGKGDLKVMDFGVARRSGETQLTMAGSLVGTANIMAPELIHGGEATPAADLFSLGCVMYEMLAGRVAFEGDDPMAVLYKIMHEQPRPLSDLRPDIPASLLQLIDRLLHKDPAGRFGPAGAVVDALDDKPTSIPSGGTMALDPGAGGTMVLPGGPGEGVAEGGEEPVEPPAEAGAGARDAVIHTEEAPEPGGGRRKWIWIGTGTAIIAAVLYAIFGDGGGRDPERAADLNRQGQRLVDGYSGNPDSLARALDLFREATRLDPENALAWNNLGTQQMGAGNREGARQSFEKAREIDGSLLNPLINLGKLHLEDGDIVPAIRSFLDVLNVDPRHAVAHIHLADARERQGQNEAAVTEYRAALASDPDDETAFTAYNNLAFLFLQTAEPESALAVVDEALGRFGQAPAGYKKFLWKNKGLAQLGTGNAAGAESSFALALEADSTYLDARVGMAHAQQVLDKNRAVSLWSELAGTTDSKVSTRAVAALTELASDPDAAVAARAREALVRIQPGS